MTKTKHHPHNQSNERKEISKETFHLNNILCVNSLSCYHQIKLSTSYNDT